MTKLRNEARMSRRDQGLLEAAEPIRRRQQHSTASSEGAHDRLPSI